MVHYYDKTTLETRAFNDADDYTLCVERGYAPAPSSAFVLIPNPIEGDYQYDDTVGLWALRLVNIDEVRRDRDERLLQSDWSQNRDIVLENDSDWVAYRQALRDITTDYIPVSNPRWPTKPN
jgi:hypothetical protein